MSAVRAVAFDAAGTLIHARPSIADCYREVGARFGSRLTTAQVADGFRAAFAAEEARDFEDGLRTDEERELRRWRTIVGTVLHDTDDADACFEELYRHLGGADVWRLYDDVAETFDALAARGLGLLIASNFDARLRAIASGHAVLDGRPLVISSEVGYRKPHRGFFDAVEKHAGVPAESILFVGDDVANDVDGPRSAGMRALLIDRKSASGVDSIGDLREVADRL